MADPRPAPSPIPPALARNPRAVRRKPGTLGVLILGRVLSAPILVAFALVIAFTLLEPVVVFLVPAQPARVLRLWVDYQPRRGTTYDVAYRFERSGFVAREIMFPDEFEQLRDGQLINAHLVRIGGLGYAALDRSLRAYARNRMILWFGSFFAAAVGGVLGYAIWFLPWLSHRLAQTGQATFGAIVAKSIYRTGRGQLSFTLTYQYKAKGRLMACRIRINPHRYDSAAVKDLVIVLFDPNRPSWSIVYDYCNFVVV